MLLKLLDIHKKFIEEKEEQETTTNTVHGFEGLKNFRKTAKIGSGYFLKNRSGGYFSYTKRPEVKFTEKGEKKVKEVYTVGKTDSQTIIGLINQVLKVDKKDLRQFGELANFIPVADIGFYPHLESGFTKKEEISLFNTFNKTDYTVITDTLKKEERAEQLEEDEFKKVFPYTYHYLMNLCEGFFPYTEAFVNWLATHLHTRKKLATSWIFKGGHGAGKDTLRTHLLEKLYGTEQVTAIDNNSVLSNFNKIIANSLCVVLNESSLSAKESNKVSSILKTWISEEKLLIEKKGIDALNEQTFFSFLAFSNNNIPLPIEIGDRRFNVMQTVKSMRQVAEEDLNMTLEEFREKFEEELDLFCVYIASLKFDYAKARLVINNRTKKNIQQSSQKRTKLFQEILTSRSVEDLHLLYIDLLEIIIAISTNKEKIPSLMSSEQFIEKETERLRTFIKNVLLGYVPVHDLSHFLILYLSDNQLMTEQSASRMLTKFFGETVRKRIDGNQVRVKHLGKELDQSLALVIASEEDIDAF